MKLVFNAFRNRAEAGELVRGDETVSPNEKTGGGGNVLVVEHACEAASSEDLSEESVSFSQHQRELGEREVRIRLLESEVATLRAREQELLKRLAEKGE